MSKPAPHQDDSLPPTPAGGPLGRVHRPLDAHIQVIVHKESEVLLRIVSFHLTEDPLCLFPPEKPASQRFRIPAEPPTSGERQVMLEQRGRRQEAQGAAQSLATTHCALCGKSSRTSVFSPAKWERAGIQENQCSLSTWDFIL